MISFLNFIVFKKDYQLKMIKLKNRDIKKVFKSSKYFN